MGHRRRADETRLSFDASRRRLTSAETRMTFGSQASTTLWSFSRDLLSVRGLGGSESNIRVRMGMGREAQRERRKMVRMRDRMARNDDTTRVRLARVRDREKRKAKQEW